VTKAGDSVILETVNLSKRFGEFYAVNRVNLKVREKTFTLLIGPNGAGKSTLLNCISGVLTPDEGKIYFNGVDLTGKAPHEITRMGIGRTFQIPAPFKRMSVIENLLVANYLHPGESFINSLLKRKWVKFEEELLDKALKVLRLIELEDKANNLAEELSGGQLKLLELGRLLMLDAKLVLTDEPISGVNPVLAEKILNTMKRLQSEMNVTFLVIEHRLDLVMPYADHVIVMANGAIACEGTPKEIVEREELYEVYLSRG